jgi:putative methyltransferase (TIGR04325 family)
VFDEIQYAWPVTAALMWAAAQCGGRLNVLDFGGALGSSYFQNQIFLSNLPHVRWSIVEQAHYVDAGQKYIQNETLRFYSSISSCLVENKPNVVLLSSVLEYLPDPMNCLINICASNPLIVIIDRSPISLVQKEIITIQKVSRSIYSATLPCRILDLTKIKRLMNDFYYMEVYKYDGMGGTGKNFSYQGMVFKKGGL